jgi:poly-beta-1,6-N-acetyl-D-glucosamine biosynthesis protein PgaD
MMNTQTHNSNPLIYDRAAVPWRGRSLQKLLDIVAWTGWFSLWMPVTIAMYKIIFEQHVSGDPILTDLWRQVSLSATMFISLWLLFVGWTKLARRRAVRLRFSQRRHATKQLGNPAICLDKLANTFSLDKELLLGWQSMQVMVAHHSEDTGWLHQIQGAEAVQFARAC